MNHDFDSNATVVLENCRATNEIGQLTGPLTLDEHFELIRSVFSPTTNDSEVSSEISGIEDVCVALASILESMENFRDPASYFDAKEISAWALEHYDYEDLNTPDPVMLSAFIFELDVFLTACLEARYLLHGPIETAHGHLSTPDFRLS